MGQVTSLFAYKVVRAVHNSVDREALLQPLGLTLDAPVDPSRMITDLDYYAFLERAVAADPDGVSLPLRVGASMRSDEYGAFGLAWKSATTLRGSFDRAARYARVLTNVSMYEVEETTGGVFMHLHRKGERHLGMRLSNENTLASIMAISGEVASQPFQPEAVYFKHKAPSKTAAHEAFFGCPVYWSTDRDALRVSTATLRTPNRLGDAGLSRFFDVHLAEQVSQLTDEVTLDQQVRDVLSTRLSEGVPTLSEVARHVHMSGRTLQRRLAETGQSYQMLLDETRHRLAKRLLRQTDFSILDVAFMTGFSDQASFTRAFKRWEEVTPRSFRLEA